MIPPQPPGRLVASLSAPSPMTMHDFADDDDRANPGGFRSVAAVDTHVYDEWTAEAEAEAREALLAEPVPPPEETTLEPSHEAPARSGRAAWLLVGGLGVSGFALVATSLAAAALAVVAGFYALI